MANIKSSKKRILTNEKKRMRNKVPKTSMRTAIKNLEKAVELKDRDLENEKLLLNVAFSKIDRAVSKGIVHKNYASRQKSRLQKKIS